MSELPIYSPTRTDTWDRCNILGYLENDAHWVPKQADNKLVGGLAGRAFALGACVIHKGGLVADAVAQANALFHSDMTYYAGCGVAFDLSLDEIVENSGIHFTLPKYATEAPFKAWSALDIEYPLPQHGRSIIDVGGLDGDGILAVADVKYKRNLDARYESSTIAEYQTSWQFMHYPWAYGEHKGQPCYRMYLCLVVYKPKFSVRLIPHEVHPETQQIWLMSARAKWARMANPDLQMEMASRHRDSFGLCSFYRACFEYHLDEGLMAQSYVKVPDRRKLTTEGAHV